MSNSIYSKRLNYSQLIKFSFSTKTSAEVKNRKHCDMIGPPDQISNLRPIDFSQPASETKIEKQFRELRQSTQEWNNKFWSGHNARFIAERKEFKEKLRAEGKESVTADEMSVFYKKFLDTNWRNHGHGECLVVTEFLKVHSDWVSEVKYYGGLRGFMSCTRCSKCSLLLSDAGGTKMRYEFSVHMGISCFAVFEESQLLMTGGPDCLVRCWSPFVPARPSAVLRGHRSPITFIAIQPPGSLAYTLSKDRCIKVWDIPSQSCIQTYNNLPSELSDRTSVSVIYNSVTQKLINASMIIALGSCQKLVDEEISDGETHVKEITCLVYNPLFKMVTAS